MNTVRSKPYGPVAEAEEKRRKPSAVVSRAQLARSRHAVERWTAWVVLLVSFLGTIAVCHGGWAALGRGLWRLATAPETAAGTVVLIGAGLLIQGVLTWLQWAFIDNWVVAYAARGVDATLTVIGWGPLFAPPLVAWAGVLGVPALALPFDVLLPVALAWGILSLTALLAAWYPETRLVG